MYSVRLIVALESDARTHGRMHAYMPAARFRHWVHLSETRSHPLLSWIWIGLDWIGRSGLDHTGSLVAAKRWLPATARTGPAGAGGKIHMARG